MNGLQLGADLRGCDPALPALHDEAALRRLCLDAVSAVGLTPVGELFHRFPAAGGVTGVVLLAESHLAVHTWPELGGVTLDAYVCNLGQDNSVRARQLLERLLAAFAPQQVERHEVERARPSRPAG